MEEAVNATLKVLENATEPIDQNLYQASTRCKACSSCRHGMWLLAASEDGKKRLRCFCSQMRSAIWDSGHFLPNGEPEGHPTPLAIQKCSFWQLV